MGFIPLSIDYHELLINSSKTVLCMFQYFDLNNDSYHDLLIGATLRSDDPTEMIEKGRSVSVDLKGSINRSCSVKMKKMHL